MRTRFMHIAAIAALALAVGSGLFGASAHAMPLVPSQGHGMGHHGCEGPSCGPVAPPVSCAQHCIAAFSLGTSAVSGPVRAVSANGSLARAAARVPHQAVLPTFTICGRGHPPPSTPVLLRVQKKE